MLAGVGVALRGDHRSRLARPSFVVRVKRLNGAAREKEQQMKYAFTIYGDESQREKASPEDMQAVSQAYGTLTQEMDQKGVLLAGEGLYPTPTAITAQGRDGESSVTDCPFAETKEQLS